MIPKTESLLGLHSDQNGARLINFTRKDKKVHKSSSDHMITDFF